jgi:hypothetical protein
VATELLIRRIHGDNLGREWQRVVLPAELVIRDSCAPCQDDGHVSNVTFPNHGGTEDTENNIAGQTL